MSFDNHQNDSDSGLSMPWRRTKDPFALRRWTQFSLELFKGVASIAIAWLAVTFFFMPFSGGGTAVQWMGYALIFLTAITAVQRLIPYFFNDWLADEWLSQADAVLRFFRRS